MPKKLRAQKITIDLPTEEAEGWAHVIAQRVFKNNMYETVQTVDRVGHINRPLARFAQQMVQVVDPVTQNTIVLSGAAVAQAIKQIVLLWLQEDFGGTINEHQDLIEDLP